MVKRDTVQILLCGLLLWAGAAMRALGLDPTKPPGANFNLTNYYLGLPVDSSGGTNGNSAAIPASQLITGYSNAWFFYTAPDGAMTFWAFVLGATTSGSSYPRSELREQLSPPSNASNWLAYGTHTLDAQCKVTQVPSTGKVIIGQIHGYTGSALPLVKIQYNNGTLEGFIKTNADNDLSDKKFIYANVGLSNLITYQIKVVDGLVSITINGTTQSLNIFQSDPDWATNTLYFKAGSYCQDNSGTTNEGSRVSFYALTRSHAPSLSVPPTNLWVVAGSNATFRVTASGNGPLHYQWRFNGTNNLGGATSASLTLTNVQTTNAGGYSVRVTDSLGAVTSVVATLTVNRPPVPGSYCSVTGQKIPIVTGTSNLLAVASDPDGDAVNLAGVNPLSASGGSVVLSNAAIYYTPLPALVGTDQWYYTLADAHGASANGVVNVTVVASNAITLNPISQQLRNDGSFSAAFQGVPGLRYVVDRATNLAGPWELDFTNLTAGGSGFFEFNDPNLPPEPMRFYRARYP